MTLGEKQELFVDLERSWVDMVLSIPGYKLRHGEGRILPNGPGNLGRRARIFGTDQKVYVTDLVHMSGGAHYTGVGADWQLFVNGKWISDGSDPAWVRVGELWEGMHELCRWGGRFKDANHISLEHEGKS